MNATAVDVATILPPETPLEMPIQSLGEGALANPRLPTEPRGMAWRRGYILGGSALMTFVAAYQIWWVLRGNGINVLEALLLMLFVALFAWIALAFFSALAGFVQIVSRRRARLGLGEAGPLPEPGVRTA